MAKRKHLSLKNHPPPHTEAVRAPVVRRPLASVLAFILLVELSKRQSDLLEPLFSSRDSFITSRKLAVVILPFAFVGRRWLPSTSSNGARDGAWVMIGVSLILSELFVRLGGVWLMQQGFERGHLLGVLALRGPPLLAATFWLAQDPFTSIVSPQPSVQSQADLETPQPPSKGGHLSALVNLIRVLLLIRSWFRPIWMT